MVRGHVTLCSYQRTVTDSHPRRRIQPTCPTSTDANTFPPPSQGCRTWPAGRSAGTVPVLTRMVPHAAVAGIECSAVNPSSSLMTLRMLSALFIGGIAMFTAIMVFIAPEVVMPQPWVIAVLLALVAVSTLLSLVLVGTLPAASQDDTVASLLPKIQSVHILRLAIMEAPAILAAVLMFLADEPSWVTVAIAAVPTILLMLLLAIPHQGVLRRYEKALDAGGARTQLTDRLLGHVA